MIRLGHNAIDPNKDLDLPAPVVGRLARLHGRHRRRKR